MGHFCLQMVFVEFGSFRVMVETIRFLAGEGVDVQRVGHIAPDCDFVEQQEWTR